MNKLQQLFNASNNPKLAIYTVVGFPTLEGMYEVLDALIEAKVDIVELGMPFSDPVADGPIIQLAHQRALENNTSIEHLFSAAGYIQAKSTTSIVAMGYINPILAYGLDKFLTNAALSGIDAVIIPDLPPEEYEHKFKDQFQVSGIKPIFLVSPNTSNERIVHIDTLSGGFLYAVSGLSVTGMLRRDVQSDATRNVYLSRLKSLKLNNPVMVGFGVKNKSDKQQIESHADGVIVGTAFIKAIADTNNIKASVEKFMEQLI